MNRTTGFTLTRREMLIGGTLGAASLLLAGCGAADPSGAKTSAAASSAEKIVVKYGAIPAAAGANYLLANTQGLFAEQGIEISEQVLRAASDAITSVVGGSADVSAANDILILKAIDQGLPLRIIASQYWTQNSDHAVIVKAGSSLSNIRDLAGKTVGIPGLGTTPQLALQVNMRLAGGDPNSIKYTTIPFPSLAASLERGDIDAAVLAEPFLSQAGDKVKIWLGTKELYKDIGGFPMVFAHYVVTADYAAKNPQVIKNFVSAIDESNKLIAAKPDLVRTAIGKWTGIDEAVLKDMRMPVWKSDPGIKSFEMQAKRCVEEGWIKKVPDMDTVFIKS